MCRLWNRSFSAISETLTVVRPGKSRDGNGNADISYSVVGVNLICPRSMCGSWFKIEKRITDDFVPPIFSAAFLSLLIVSSSSRTGIGDVDLSPFIVFVPQCIPMVYDVN